MAETMERAGETAKPYRYDEISLGGVLKDFTDFHGGPLPGEPVPDFDLITTDGKRARKSDYAGRPLLVTFASCTCPMTKAASPALRALHERFGGRAGFLSVYVREAHPGDLIPQAPDADEKLSRAAAYQRRDDISWTVGVDALEGDFHQAMGGHPNAAYLIDAAGDVAFRSLWSTDIGAIGQALEAVVEGRPAPRAQAKAKVGPLLCAVGCISETIEQAGPQAQRQARRTLAPVYGLGKIARAFTPLSPAARGAAAVAVVGGVLGLALSALLSRRRRDD
jgi:hypothetical protein